MEFKKENGKVLIEKPCKYCGGVYATMHEGKGPHAAELRCKECGRHNQWMSKADCKAYQCYLTDIEEEIYFKIMHNGKYVT